MNTPEEVEEYKIMTYVKNNRSAYRSIVYALLAILLCFGSIALLIESFFRPDVTIARNNIHCHCQNTAHGSPKCCFKGCNEDCESPNNICKCHLNQLKKL